MREEKLRNGVKWQGEIQQNAVRQIGAKQV
jgi:hypothetical protein